MGRILKRLLTALVGLAVIAAVGLYIVGNYSELRQELVCAGHWKDAPTENETTYVQLNEYRWWVRLWSNTHGNATVQTDKHGLSTYLSDVRRVHDGRLAMYSFHDRDFSKDQLGKFRGGYRAANKEIVIEFLPTGIQ